MPLLFHFHCRDELNNTTFSWRYTNDRRDRLVDGETYVARPIESGRWGRGLDDAEMTLKVPADLPVVSFFVADNPPSNLWLTILDLEERPVLRFQGKVTKVKFRFLRYSAEIKAQAMSRLAVAEIPRRRFGRGCDWELFEPACGANRLAYRVAIPVSDVAVEGGGRELVHATLATKPDGWFSGGYAQCGFERAYITGHTGSSVFLLSRFQQPIAANFEFFPGCDKGQDHCRDKFNNIAHYGGFPFIPTKNPVTSGI